MLQGKLIKFYREQTGLTQGKLVEGICSVTHLSKIERGITEYSGEITDLLANRLNINLDDEFSRYNNLQQKLDQWHNSLIMQQNKESETLKKEIENEKLIHIPDFYVFFQLLSARYYLSIHKLDSAYSIIQDLQKKESTFSPRDRNMLKHVLGIYYYLQGQYRESIHILTTIDQNEYNQFEYYYHLTIAYHSIHSNIISYYYAEKVLHYFQKTFNVKRIIDTEMMMLIQLNSKELHDFNETKERYEQLIRTCDSIHDMDRKSKLYHNLAFELYRRKRYRDASDLYQQSMKLIDENNPYYLTVLDGYINACYKGNLLSIEILKNLAYKGLNLANSKKAFSWIYFQLHIYLLNQEEENFFQFIETTALPHFKDIGYTILIEHYEKKLFQYYIQTGETTKALSLANSCFQGGKSYYDHE
ncbi:helix-turn-helix domain-containing protein [Peribacillus alkalitolerans]|uniref:helix-turn-helix domain-containing protein n=1 Tax=Peribacillus alkalitolerans TaxID=1550385 RepID=UPI0013D3E5DE|nr:helix-turn-helix transcriptional regulator [Peribacillus alkalitolerans]